MKGWLFGTFTPHIHIYKQRGIMANKNSDSHEDIGKVITVSDNEGNVKEELEVLTSSPS